MELDIFSPKYDFWREATKKSCVTYDTDRILTGGVPSSPTEECQRINILSAVSEIIREYVLEAIRVELPGGCLSQEPPQISHKIAELHFENSETVHRRREFRKTP